MNPIRIFIALLTATIIGLASFGCVNADAVGQRNASAKAAYLAQQRSMDVIKAEFVDGIGQQAGGSVTITGLKSLTLSNALTPLAAPAAEPTLAQTVVDGAVRIAPIAGTAYVVGKAIDSSGTTTSTTKTTTTGTTATTTP